MKNVIFTKWRIHFMKSMHTSWNERFHQTNAIYNIHTKHINNIYKECVFFLNIIENSNKCNICVFIMYIYKIIFSKAPEQKTEYLTCLNLFKKSSIIFTIYMWRKHINLQLLPRLNAMHFIYVRRTYILCTLYVHKRAIRVLNK